MADIKSNYLRGKLLNAVLNGTVYTPPALYLALFTDQAVAAGLQAGTLTKEVSVGAYARQSIGFDAPTSTGDIANDATITFPIATAYQGEIKAWAVVDAQSGGNVLYFGDFDEKNGVGSGWKEIAVGDAFLVRSGDITIKER